MKDKHSVQSYVSNSLHQWLKDESEKAGKSLSRFSSELLQGAACNLGYKIPRQPTQAEQAKDAAMEHADQFDFDSTKQLLEKLTNRLTTLAQTKPGQKLCFSLIC